MTVASPQGENKKLKEKYKNIHLGNEISVSEE